MNTKYVLNEAKDYAFILVGVILYAMGVTVFMLPYGLTSGGVSGIASIIYYATGIEVQVSYIAVNAVLMIIAIKTLGIKFCLKTIFGVLTLTLALWTFQRVIEQPSPDAPETMLLPRLIGDEAFMAAILGSICCGIGLAFCFENNGSTGGTDIIAAVVHKYKPISLGEVIRACDIIIVSSCYFIFHDWYRVICFNTVISAKPYLHEPYYYRALAKFYLEDYAGAQADITTAIDKSPFNSRYYQLRAICHINTQQYPQAIADYQVALSQNTTDKPSWHNMVYCMIETKQLDSADHALDSILTLWPTDPTHHTMKAEVAIMKQDTLLAESYIDHAIELDPYDGTAWSMKAVLLLSHDSCAQAEDALNRAISQKPRHTPLYVQRALARYHQNNLRGAMSDYDRAIELDKTNYVAHYNRGLLRAQVGEDNLAIEDLDYILTLDPHNMIALYNRAILLDQTGDYHGAIRDISAVIDQYPQFWTGYRHRASILRKIGDKYGAERDEFRVLKAEMEVRTGTYKAQKTTRKKEDHDINAYNKLITDEQEDNKVLYASEWRGKIQNRKVELRPLPNYLLSFYRGQNEPHKYVAYSTHVDRINNRHLLDQPLCLTTQEATLDTALIAHHQRRLHQSQPTTKALQLALDHYLVRDFESTISVLSQSDITTPTTAPLIYFLRAQAHQAKAHALQSDNSTTPADQHLQHALSDISRAIELDPTFAYAHYNQGNIYLQLQQYDKAIESYTRAIEANPQLPDPYYNRAIAYIHTKQKEKALADFSRAGEMGIYQAYSHIKKYSREGS